MYCNNTSVEEISCLIRYSRAFSKTSFSSSDINIVFLMSETVIKAVMKNKEQNSVALRALYYFQAIMNEI